MTVMWFYYDMIDAYLTHIDVCLSYQGTTEPYCVVTIDLCYIALTGKESSHPHLPWSLWLP